MFLCCLQLLTTLDDALLSKRPSGLSVQSNECQDSLNMLETWKVEQGDDDGGECYYARAIAFGEAI